ASNFPGFGDTYQAFSPNNPSPVWQASASNPPGLSLGGNTWVIAANLAQAVPEPGSLTLALLGLSCLAAAALWPRRQRRAATRPPLGPIAHSCPSRTVAVRAMLQIRVMSAGEALVGARAPHPAASGLSSI